jgi:hypothetical protein
LFQKTTLQKLETIQNTGMILIGGFAKTTYSCYGSNHGNGKPMTQKGLDGKGRGLKEHLQH